MLGVSWNYWDCWSATGGETDMPTSLSRQLRERRGGHFYENAGVHSFMQTVGWTLLCKRWGGHLYANAGVDTFMHTLGWTCLCKRWGGHFYANAGVDTV